MRRFHTDYHVLALVFPGILFCCNPCSKMDVHSCTSLILPQDRTSLLFQKNFSYLTRLIFILPFGNAFGDAELCKKSNGGR